MAAALSVHPRAAIAFQRQRIELPDRLPDVLLEPVMLDGFELVEEPGGKLHKDARAISRLLADPTNRNLLWLMNGPASATTRRHGVAFDDSFVGWGGEECEWGYRKLAGADRVLLGPIVFHQEHEVESDAERQTEGAENFRRLLSKLGGAEGAVLPS